MVRKVVRRKRLKVLGPTPQFVVCHEPRRRLQKPHGVNHVGSRLQFQHPNNQQRRRHFFKGHQFCGRGGGFRQIFIVRFERNVAVIHLVFVVGEFRHKRPTSLLTDENAIIHENPKRPTHRPLTHGKRGRQLHFVRKHLARFPFALADAFRNHAADLFEKRFTPERTGVGDKAEVVHVGGIRMVLTSDKLLIAASVITGAKSRANTVTLS